MVAEAGILYGIRCCWAGGECELTFLLSYIIIIVVPVVNAIDELAQRSMMGCFMCKRFWQTKTMKCAPYVTMTSHSLAHTDA